MELLSTRLESRSQVGSFSARSSSFRPGIRDDLDGSGPSIPVDGDLPLRTKVEGLKRWKTFDFQQLKASPLNPELGARERTRTSISRGEGRSSVRVNDEEGNEGRRRPDRCTVRSDRLGESGVD